MLSDITDQEFSERSYKRAVNQSKTHNELYKRTWKKYVHDKNGYKYAIEIDEYDMGKLVKYGFPKFSISAFFHTRDAATAFTVNNIYDEEHALANIEDFFESIWKNMDCDYWDWDFYREEIVKNIQEDFILVIKKYFPDVKDEPAPSTRPELNRINLYIPNNRKNKRWMQIDCAASMVTIAMDHNQNEISETTVRNSGIPYGLNAKNSRIELHNNDSVRLSISIKEPIDFEKKQIMEFLEKHFQSYRRRISV